jgi:hypothetical protein
MCAPFKYPAIEHMVARSVVLAAAAVALVALATLAYGTYSQPELTAPETGPWATELRWLALASPALAAVVPAAAAIALRRSGSIGMLPLVALGGFVAALYFVVPLLIGLQRSAPGTAIASATMFISWLAAAAGIAGAVAAAVPLWVDAQVRNWSITQHHARLVAEVERQLRPILDSDRTPTAVELGAQSYAALTREWGTDATHIVVSRGDVTLIGISSPRWPASPTVPSLEIPIIQTDAGEHVRVRADRAQAAPPADVR